MATEKTRFEFGKNWQSFLTKLDIVKIQEAEKSLLTSLQKTTLEGMNFLDIGSGSGLFSLAARRLGATVYSFDFDENSVACALELKKRYFPQDEKWQIEQGSVLDKTYLNTLGQFDVVYSWGVLHHTGDMYHAFENVSSLVKPNGYLFIAIYNDQGNASLRWKWIKKTYNQSNFIIRYVLTAYTLFRQWGLTFFKDLFTHGNPIRTWRRYSKERGMSPYHDLIDWVGGYPFEVAKPEAVFNFFKPKSFELMMLKTCAGGIGCNEFVFQKASL